MLRNDNSTNLLNQVGLRFDNWDLEHVDIPFSAISASPARVLNVMRG